MVLVADSEHREGPWPGTGLGAQPVRTGRRQGREAGPAVSEGDGRGEAGCRGWESGETVPES